MKSKVLISIAAGLTAIVLVAALGVIFAPPVRTVLASALYGSAPYAGPWHGGGGGWGNGAGFNLPPELQGLMSIPADQRFDHFVGIQVNLKDQNNKPLAIDVVAGKVTAESATSLTIAANSGNNQTFSLNAQTMIHSHSNEASATPSATQPASNPLQNGDDVVVVTLNNSTTATAVIDGGPNGFAMPGHGGWQGMHNSGQ